MDDKVFQVAGIGNAARVYQVLSAHACCCMPVACVKDHPCQHTQPMLPAGIKLKQLNSKSLAASLQQQCWQQL
jgi:hypothetical protein